MENMHKIWYNLQSSLGSVFCELTDIFSKRAKESKIISLIQFTVYEGLLSEI